MTNCNTTTTIQTKISRKSLSLKERITASADTIKTVAVFFATASLSVFSGALLGVLCISLPL